MDSSGRYPGAAAKVPRMSGGLRRDRDRNRTFSVNRSVFTDAVGNTVCGVTCIPCDWAGAAFDPLADQHDLSATGKGQNGRCLTVETDFELIVAAQILKSHQLRRIRQ